MRRFLLVIILSIFISVILVLLGLLASLKMNKDIILLSPFECGFSPRTITRPPFSLHFFIIALVFIIFDVELIIIFPYYLHLYHFLDVYGRILFIIFVVILILGLFNEWNQLVLKWVE